MVQNVELASLVDAFAESSASNPRDKIYAFLGLTNQYDLPEPAPVKSAFKGADYGRDRIAVYTDFTVDCIMRHQSLACLALAEKHVAGLPSWACNWAYDGVAIEQTSIWGWGSGKSSLGQFARYNACASRPAICRRYDPDKLTITLTGWHVDGIQATSRVGKPLALEESLTLWEEFVHSQVADQGRAQELFLRIITGDAWTGDFPDDWKDCFRKGRNEGARKITYSDISDVPFPVKFSSWVTAACAGRRLFVTTKGLLGLGPPKMLPVDHICILEGSNVPCLLCPHPKRSDWKNYEPGRREEFVFERPNRFRGQVILLHHMYFDNADLQHKIERGEIVPRDIQLE